MMYIIQKRYQYYRNLHCGFGSLSWPFPHTKAGVLPFRVMPLALILGGVRVLGSEQLHFVHGPVQDTLLPLQEHAHVHVCTP
jgi:hypothetical protein